MQARRVSRPGDGPSSACAIPSRCSMPRENVESSVRAASSSPTRARSAAVSLCEFWRARPTSCAVEAHRLSRSEVHRKVRLLGQEAERPPDPRGLVESSPRTSNVPPVGRTRPSSIFSVVVLPAPFGPRSPWMRPGSTRMETSSHRIAGGATERSACTPFGHPDPDGG